MKKLMSMLLCLVMLFGVLAGCSQEPAPVVDTPAEPAVTEPAAEPETPAEEPEAPADEPEAEITVSDEGYGVAENESGIFTGMERNETGEYSTGGLVLPLSEETKTFSIFAQDVGILFGAPTLAETIVYQEAEKRTNIHIDWDAQSLLTYAEKFNLSLVSGDYPDAYTNAVFTGGFDGAIEDEIIIDLSEILPTYAPNYYALSQVNETARRSSLTDGGNMPFFATVTVGLSVEPTWNGFWVRQDMLDNTGIDYNTVNTIDEYHDMLVALAPYCEAQPLLLPASGACDQLAAAWNIVLYGEGTGSFHQENGKVVYGPATNGFKEYLKTLAQWYQEGLIHKDFTSSTSGDYALTNEVALFTGTFSLGATNPTASGIDGYALSPMYMAVLEEGQTRHVSMTGGMFFGNVGSVITSAGEDPETLASWFDYWYSEEGFYLGNYGIEGESWEWMEGYDRPVFTDLVEQNPNGLPVGTVRLNYATSPYHNKLYDWRIGYLRSYGDGLIDMSLNVRDADYDAAYQMPAVTLTQEESADYASAFNDINTYVNEMMLKFITGVEDVDAQWDAYMAALENFGLETMLEIQQAALDRYYSK